MATLDTLEEVTVEGYGNPWEILVQQVYLPAYQNISDFAWDTFANQPNWVQTIQPGAPLYTYTEPDLPTVEVVGIRPKPPTEDLRDSEGYSYNPETGRNYPPTWQMNDAEYASFLGGGDAAYEQMWAERHPNEPDESFVGPAAIPYTPTSPGFRGSPTARPGVNPNWPYSDPGPQIGDPNYRYSLRPNKPTAPELISSFGSSLLRLLPWLTMFVPQPMGPRAWDEAPEWWDLPPVRYRPGPTVTPLAPFEDPTIEYPYPRRIEFPDNPTTIRPVLPISDNPGVFADPVALPDWPMPEFDPGPGPRTLPRTDWPAPFPYSDPYTPVIGRPYVDTPVVPYVPGDPYSPGDIPRESPPYVPPRIADPFAPPEVFTPTEPKTPLAPPKFDIPVDLLYPDTYVPRVLDQPEDADSCNCNDKKKKKKKKREPRSVCYRGTYFETRSGLTKHRIEEVPCEDRAPAKAKATKRKAPVSTFTWSPV